MVTIPAESRLNVRGALGLARETIDPEPGRRRRVIPPPLGIAAREVDVAPVRVLKIVDQGHCVGHEVIGAINDGGRRREPRVS